MHFAAWVFFTDLKQRGAIREPTIFRRSTEVDTDEVENSFRTVLTYARTAGSKIPDDAPKLLHQVISGRMDWGPFLALAQPAADESEPNGISETLLSTRSVLLLAVSEAAKASFDALQRSGASPYVIGVDEIVWRRPWIPYSEITSREFMTWLELVFAAELVKGLVNPGVEDSDLPEGIDVRFVTGDQFIAEFRRVMALYESQNGRLDLPPRELSELLSLVRS